MLNMDVDNEDDERRPVAAETLREAYHSVRVRKLATMIFVLLVKCESEPTCVAPRAWRLRRCVRACRHRSLSA